MHIGLALIILSIFIQVLFYLDNTQTALKKSKKLMPYLGLMILPFTAIGFYGLVQFFKHIHLLSVFPIWWLSFLATTLFVIAISVVFIYQSYIQLRFNIHNVSYEQSLRKLQSFSQHNLLISIIGIFIGIWCIIAYYYFAL